MKCNQKNNKLLLILCLSLLIFNFNINEIKAATAPDKFTYKYYGGDDDQICFNKETGVYRKHTSNWCGGGKTGPWGIDRVKYFDSKDNLVYCAEWNKDIGTDYPNYVKDSKWSATSAHALIIGNAVNIIQKDNTDSMKEYANAGATINHYFRNKVTGFGFETTSYLFKTPATFITSAISEATTLYNNTIKGKTAKGSIPNITTDKTVAMTYLNNKDYISNQITISNLQKTFGNSGDTVNYTITATTSAGKVVLCTAKNKCSTSNTITINGKTSYSFYVKLTGTVDSNTDVKVNIVGSNQSTYYTAYLYKNTAKTSYQRLLFPTTMTVKREEKATISLNVPDVNNYVVKAYKVDEIGEPVDANLNLTRAGNKETFAKSKNTFTWSKKISETEKSYFYNAEFCVTEVSTADGFILNPEAKTCVTPKEIENAKKCYAVTEGEETEEVEDLELCNWSSYDYKCEYNGDIKDIPAESDCNSIMKYEKKCVDANNTVVDDAWCSGQLPGNNYPKCVNSTNANDIQDIPETGDCASIVTYQKKCTKIDGTNYSIADEKYCGNEDKYMSIEQSGNNLIINVANKRNSVTVSKVSTNSKTNDELPGAYLKICNSADYKAKGEECSAASTIDNTEMQWYTTATPRTWNGLKKGDYTIVEQEAPLGYLKESTKTISFNINEKGEITLIGSNGTLENSVKDENGKITEYVITLKNNLNKLKISKQDIATSKELPGAKLSICESYKDPEDNQIKVVKSQYTDECLPVTLANGTAAEWISTDKPHEIEGLPAGTYFLVEKIQPKGYELAESIIFTVTSDGKILDAKNQPINDKKIIMKDKKLEQVQTGDLPIIPIIIIGIAGLTTGIISYKKAKAM